MKEYLNLLKYVLEEGQQRDDRTKTGTISKFGVQKTYDLRNGFPLLTTKKVYFKAIVYEILWFIHGDTNIKYLVDHNVNIWNEWPFETYKKSINYQNETLEEFIQKIKTDDEFAKQHGQLGPVYGKQWRDFNGVDQLNQVIDQIKNNPFSRRIILSSWNPSEVDQMALPPCHTLCQFYVSKDGYLDLQLYQRSGDLFLGVPFNIASYSLLLTLIALECNLKPRYFVHTIGDAHIYSNHLEQVELQLKREPLPLPELEINFQNKSIFEIDYEDIHLKNYESYAPIKARVAV